MDFFKRDVEQELQQWNLFKVYGEFNLYFEAMVAQYRELLIDLVRKYYGFDVDWEDLESETELNYHMQDRLLKIILHDAGAAAIIEKCRSCFVEMCNPEMRNILSMNDIEPMSISEHDLKCSVLLFKKTKELVELRNIIIHTHYGGIIYNFLQPVDKLVGRRDHRAGTGYVLKTYQFNIDYFEKTNNQIEDIAYYVHLLTCGITSEDKENIFKEGDFEKINEMKFVAPEVKSR